MNKLCVLLAGLMAISICVIAVNMLPPLAHADEAHAAMVFDLDNKFWNLIDGNGALINIVGPDGHLIITQSATGNVLINLSAKVPNDTGKAAKWDSWNNPWNVDGLIYNIFWDGHGWTTTNWQIIVSASGKLTYAVKLTDEDMVF